MRPLISFFKANPQVFILFLICLVLGVGTFLVVLFAIAGSGSSNLSGEPSGAILGLRLLAGV